jgi:hypothetical protein
VPAVTQVDEAAVGADRRGKPERRVAEAAEHDRVADQEEADEAQAEDGEVGAHHVRRVLRPAEAGLHQREAGLHEDHEHRTDDDPEVVQCQIGVGDALDRIDVD